MLTQKDIATYVIHKICDTEGAVTVSACLENVTAFLVVHLLRRVVVIPSGWPQSPGGRSPHYTYVSINKNSTGMKISISWLQKRVSCTKLHTTVTEVFALKAICNLQTSLFSSRIFQGITQVESLVENITVYAVCMHEP